MKRFAPAVHPFRLLHVLLFSLGLLLAGAPLPGLAAARAGAETRIDVAAMALTPADLESAGLEGWAIAGGQALTPGAAASSLAFERELSDVATQTLVDASGLVEGYELRLELPGETPELPAQAARSTVFLFDDEEGATSAFAFLTSADSARFGEPVDNAASLGDESAVTRLEGTTTDPFQALELTVRAGRIIAQVRLVDFSADDPMLRDLDALGARLLEQVDATLAGDSPAMRASTLALADSDAVVEHAYYTIVNGEPRQLLGQSADDVTTKSEQVHGDGLSDEFEVRERISDPVGSGTIWVLFTSQQFASADQASVSLRGTPDRSAASGQFTDVREIPELQAFGDESIAYTMTLDWAPQQTTYVYQTYGVRVGDRLGWIDLISAERLPATTLEDLARAQAACFTQDRCDGLVAFSPSPASGALGDSLKPREMRNGDEQTANLAIPELGLDLTYDSAEWQFQDENWLATDGLVLLMQRDAGSVVSFGLDSDSATARDCVGQRTQALADDEAFGAARSIESGSRNAAAYGIHLAENDETFLYIECRPLADDVGFAVIIQIGPLTDFDARSADREALLAGLQPTS